MARTFRTPIHNLTDIIQWLGHPDHDSTWVKRYLAGISKETRDGKYLNQRNHDTYEYQRRWKLDKASHDDMKRELAA